MTSARGHTVTRAYIDAARDQATRLPNRERVALEATARDLELALRRGEPGTRLIQLFCRMRRLQAFHFGAPGIERILD
jgi:hypothetical protein